MLGVPTYDQPLVTGDPNQLPVRINADKTEANYPDNALFTGNVIVQQGNSTLTANQVELTQVQKPGEVIPLRTVTATGDVNYDDPQIKLKGPKGWSNLNTKDTDMDKGKYQMVGRQGRGDADLMKLRDQSRYTILKNGTFTSCLPGDNSWSVVGSESFMTAKNKWLKFGMLVSRLAKSRCFTALICNCQLAINAVRGS